MTDPEIQSIRTRADGSIDTAYYMTRGRQMRSKQAHHMAQDMAAQWRPFSWMGQVWRVATQRRRARRS